MSHPDPSNDEVPLVGGPLNGQKTTKRAQTLHPDGSTAATNAVSLNDCSAYHAFEWIRSTREFPRWRYYSLIHLSQGAVPTVRSKGLVYLWAPLWCHRQMIDLIYRDPETFELEWDHAVKVRGVGHVQQRYAAIMGAVR